MRLLKITNQPNQKRYGELVLLDDNDKVVHDIVYDGKGYHNYPERVHGDFLLAKQELNTYGKKGVTELMNYYKQHYGIKEKK